MFLPSGRVHAIGRGLVIFEIQQNSDTTYRVFDWNRVDSTGKPRDLHIAESLASINFEDFEPRLITGEFSDGPLRKRPLVAESIFSVAECELVASSSVRIQSSQMLVLGVLTGGLHIEHNHTRLKLGPGQFSLIPAAVREFTLSAETPARFLQAKTE